MNTQFAIGPSFRKLPAPAVRWTVASAMLVVGLIFYCELCSLVYGEGAVGLRVSAVWALQAGLGWIVVGGGLGAYGRRIAESAIARRHAQAAAVVSVLILAAFAITCEVLLVWLWGDPRDGTGVSILRLVYARAPVSVLASALLVGAWILHRRSASGATTTALQPSAVGPREPELAPTGYGAADVIDVMTGTGRTTIRMADVESFRADRNYITVAHVSGKRYLLRQTMASLERSLDRTVFERIHRSTIVNRAMVIERRRNGALVLKSGETVQISRAARRKRSV